MFAYSEATGTEPTCITSFGIMRRLVRYRQQINDGERCCRCEGGRLNHNPPLLRAGGGGTSCRSESPSVVKSPASSESTYRRQSFNGSLEKKTHKLTSCSSEPCIVNLKRLLSGPHLCIASDKPNQSINKCESQTRGRLSNICQPDCQQLSSPLLFR